MTSLAGGTCRKADFDKYAIGFKPSSGGVFHNQPVVYRRRRQRQSTVLVRRIYIIRPGNAYRAIKFRRIHEGRVSQRGGLLPREQLAGILAEFIERPARL